jgi:hypothetical protein
MKELGGYQTEVSHVFGVCSIYLGESLKELGRRNTLRNLAGLRLNKSPANTKIYLCLNKHYDLKTCGGNRGIIHINSYYRYYTKMRIPRIHRTFRYPEKNYSCYRFGVLTEVQWRYLRNYLPKQINYAAMAVKIIVTH